MNVFPLLLFVALLAGVQSIKKCRINCEDKYMPVCGHDHRLGYQTFCSVDALSQCNKSKGNNYTRVADGPCYPSVREWKTQSTPLAQKPALLQAQGAGKQLEETKQQKIDLRNSSQQELG